MKFNNPSLPEESLCRFPLNSLNRTSTGLFFCFYVKTKFLYVFLKTCGLSLDGFADSISIFSGWLAIKVAFFILYEPKLF